MPKLTVGEIKEKILEVEDEIVQELNQKFFDECLDAMSEYLVEEGEELERDPKKRVKQIVDLILETIQELPKETMDDLTKRSEEE